MVLERVRAGRDAHDLEVDPLERRPLGSQLQDVRAARDQRSDDGRCDGLGFIRPDVQGTIGGEAFASNLMPAGGGRLALSVNKGMMKAAAVAVGDTADFEITAVGRE